MIIAAVSTQDDVEDINVSVHITPRSCGSECVGTAPQPGGSAPFEGTLPPTGAELMGVGVWIALAVALGGLLLMRAGRALTARRAPDVRGADEIVGHG